MRRFVRILLLAATLAGLAKTGASGQLRVMDATLEVTEASVTELQQALSSGEITSVQLVDAYLARIAAYDQAGPRLNAMLRLNPNARAEAAALDAERARGNVRSLLHGIPIVIKDNFDTRDMPTTAASIALAGMVPPDDAEQVKRLRDAGVIILGKTNLHELAAGITTISSLGGQTLNPYDPTRNPGGSSGGTSAAVAASFAALGWGSDTCGSIRIPAAQTGLFGLRPTKGLTSTDGVIPLSHTQDVAGPLARTATDLAIGLDIVVSADASMLPAAGRNGRSLPRFVEALDTTALRGARFGVLRAHFGTSPEEDVVNVVIDRALDQMRANGATVLDIEIAELDSLLEESSVISYEFKHDLIDYLEATPNAPVRSIAEILERGLYHVALEERLRLRDRLGTRDSEDYRAALDRHERLRAVVTAALDADNLDAIVYPTIRREPVPVGDSQRGGNCQLSASTGFPALSVPAGFTVNGLPVGLELMGRPWSDARLLAVGFAFEQATRHRRAPAFTPPLPTSQAPQRPPVELSRTSPDGSRLRALLTWDPVSGTLDYDIAVTGARADRVYAVTFERGDEAHGRGVVQRMSGPGVLGARGQWKPSAADRTDLLNGSLVIALYTEQQPNGAVRIIIPPYR